MESIPEKKSLIPSDRGSGDPLTDPSAWLDKTEAEGNIIHCEKRAARMHVRFCDIIRKAVPTVADTGHVDKTLKSVNVCNSCPVSKAKLSVRRFLEFKNQKDKESVE